MSQPFPTQCKVCGGASPIYISHWCIDCCKQVIGQVESSRLVLRPLLEIAQKRVIELETMLKGWEEAEARCCPEDVGFEEYIRRLEGELRQLRGDTTVKLNVAKPILNCFAASPSRVHDAHCYQEGVKL